ncbi:MAG: hypothetical protein ACJA2S_003682 [Cyclobacteriaceae bacterium]
MYEEEVNSYPEEITLLKIEMNERERELEAVSDELDRWKISNTSILLEKDIMKQHSTWPMRQLKTRLDLFVAYLTNILRLV